MIISLGKLVRGGSPQDVGYQVVTQMQRKAKDSLVSSPLSSTHGAEDETRPKIVTDLMIITLQLRD